MGSLSNLYISQSYQSLIHLATNNTASATLIGLEDGLGNPIGVSVNTAGNLYLSGTFSASLQEGYIYVGNSSGRTIAFPTSSFITELETGSLLTTASFNAYTASTNIRLSNIELTTASVLVSINNINTFTSSANISINALNVFTASQSTASLETSITNLNQFTQSQESFNSSATASIVALQNFSSSLDANFVTEAELAAATGSLITQINTKLNTSSFNSYTSSNNQRVNSLESNSASVNTSITNINSFTQSANIRLNNLETTSASVNISIANINSTTASQATSISNLNTSASLALTTASLSGQTLTFTKGDNSTFGIILPDVSGSDITALNQFTASQLNINTGYNTFTSSANQRLGSLETTSASVNISVSSLNTFTASQSTASIVTSIDNLNQFTQSAGISINSLNSATSSYITESETASFARTNIDNNFTANQTFTNITAVSASITYLTTIFETASVIYSSGSNQLGDELTDIQTLSGSVKVQGSLTINGTPVQTSSFDPSALNQATASLQAFTQSANIRLNNLESTSASVNVSITNINSFTSSQQSFNASATASIVELLNLSSSLSGGFVTEGELAAATASLITQIDTKLNTSSFNSYTQSNDQRVSSLESNSASVNISITNLNASSASQQISIDALNVFTASQSTASIVTSINNLNSFTQSADIRLTNIENTTASLNTSITNINTFSASALVSISNLNTNSASVNTSISALNTFTASQSTASIVTSINNLNTFSASALVSISNINLTTASLNTSVTNINQATASLFTSASLAIVTASVNNDDITFTKGDGTQFTIQVATGSFAISASYAETASLAINAKDIVVDVKNTTGGTLTKGTVVRIIGATGDNALIGTASWEDDNNSANTLGFVVTDISNDAFGRVMTQGTLLSVNTDPALGYAAGDLVYLSSSGQFTKVIPPAPYHEVRLGQVLRAQQNNGSIYVLIQNGYELSELHDVDINTGSLATNNLLAYNSASGQWENKTLTEVGATTTASFNQYTSSTNSRLTNIESTTASLLIETQNLELFSASALTSLSNLNTATASLFTSTSLSLTTASFSGNTLTFTKGDNSTFGIVIPDVSGSTINTGSFATTGSNSFNGSQTITGSITTTQDITVSSVKFGFGNPAGTSSIAIGNSNTLQNNTGQSNVAIGVNALNLNVTGNNSVAIGTNALQNALANNNTGIGANTLKNAKANSDSNTAIGQGALENHFDGDTHSGDNMAFGLDAMANVTSGSANTAIGTAALRDPSRANENVYIGWIAGINASGSISENVVIGPRAGQKTAGSSNTIIGHSAGSELVNGGANVFIGQGAGSAIITGSSNTLIGRSLSGVNNWNNVIALSIGDGAIKTKFQSDIWQFTGSVDIQNTLTASLQQGHVLVGNASGRTVTVATSSFGTAINTGSFATTSSLNAYTQSNDQRVNSLESNSASVNTSVANINTFTQSANISINALNAATSSYVTSAITASSLITASVNLNTITFTKGDNTTFNLTVATGSGGGGGSTDTGSLLVTASFASTNITFTKGDATTFNLGGFATTGSNTFRGSNTFNNTPSDEFKVNWGSASSASMYTENSGGPQQTLNITSASVYLNRGSLFFTSGSIVNSGDTIQFNAFPSASFVLRTQNGGTAEIRANTDYTDMTQPNGLVRAYANGNIEIIGKGGAISITGSSGTSMQGFTYPNTDGTNGQVLTTDGNKNLTFTTVSGGSINTGSFATTGSNTFRGIETFEDAGGNATSLVPVSGSLMLVAKGFTSASAHISASATSQINLIFKNTNDTADTVLSGSNNIFTNPITPQAGFKRYIGGSNNIINTINVPQRSGSMQFSPGFNANYFVGILNMRGPVSSSAWNINNNVIVGNINVGTNATNNAEKLTAGLTMTGNSIAGNLNIIANQTPLTGSTTIINNNNINGVVGLNLSSSAISIQQSSINDGNFILTNQFSSGALGLGLVSTSNNTIGGSSNTLIVTGSVLTGSAQPTIFNNLVIGAVNTGFINTSDSRISGANVYQNLLATSLLGNRLIVTGSSLGTDLNSFGSLFVGRWNASDGIKNKTSDVIFAVGTGTSTTRKTGFLIDSGSNTFVEGTFNVSGSSTFTGSVNITGSLLVNGASVSINTGSFATTGSNTFTGVNTFNERIDVQNIRILSGSATGIYMGNNPNFSPIGAGNTCIGSNALNQFVSGGDNTVLGRGVLQNLRTGSENLAMGTFAGEGLLTGSNNTFIGTGAGSNFGLGDNNFFLGKAAGNQFRSGSGNIIIGESTGTNFMTGSESLIIGRYGDKVADNVDFQFSLTYGGLNSAKRNLFYKSGSQDDNLFLYGGLEVDKSLIVSQAATISGSLTITGSATIGNVLQLTQLNPLPTGADGQLAVSASNLYFFSGSAWNRISFA